MKTQIIIVYKPVAANVALPSNSTEIISEASNYNYKSLDNPNYLNEKGFIAQVRPKNEYLSLDLYDDIDIPLTYTILDIREPEKRKTNFSKTIKLPGTKNNNRIFNHIYEVSGSSKFNPNIRKEVIIIQGGVQVMRGNMQLKSINRKDQNFIDYDVLISGDFTSLFADVGVSKLSDLDLTEWEHEWSAENVKSTWTGLATKNDGTQFSLNTYGSYLTFSQINRDSATGRVKVTTSSNHNLLEGNWIILEPTPKVNVVGDVTTYKDDYLYGEYQIAEKLSNTQFTINYPFPNGMFGLTASGRLRKVMSKGQGYTYPMISWGDDQLIDINGTTTPRFSVTSFVPAFYVKQIWDKIFSETNSRYDSDFLDSEFFKRLVIVQKKQTYDVPESEISERSFKVANQLNFQLQLSGFATQSTGNLSNQFRGFPFNQPYTQPFPFTASIAGSDGFLYNGSGTYSTPFDQSTYIWTVSDTGSYNVKFNIAFDMVANISDWRANVGSNNWSYVPPSSLDDYEYWWGGFGTNPSTRKVEVIVKVILRRNGLIAVLDQVFLSFGDDVTQQIKDTYKNFRWKAKQVNIDITKDLQQGDEVWIEVFNKSTFDNDNSGVFTQLFRDTATPYDPGANWTYYKYRGDVRVRSLAINYFEAKPIPQLKEGSTIYPNQFLPKDMTCKDFLIGIIRMFNLHIESDREVEKLYKIEPRDTYYEDGTGGVTDYIDWTEKVDTSTIDIIPMGELTAKFYQFSYKQESDYWNKKYKEQTSEGYGDHLVEIQNDFLTNTQKIEIPFGASVMINSPRTSDIIIPQIVQKESSGFNKITTSAAKILHWSGVRPTTTQGVPLEWQLLRTYQSIATFSVATFSAQENFTYYPYAGTCDSPLDPLQDLNFYYTDYVFFNRARWSNENLYNKYWKRFIEEITDIDSKVIRCKLFLTPRDLNELDFKKIYVINGAYLRLQKIIDYNANGSELTQCEFLKLKSPSKFVRRSVVASDNFTELSDVSRPITVVTTERPPQPWNNTTNLTNKIPDELTTVQTITVNGQNNVVQNNTNNVSIQGNENYVSSNSQNINISGGDGVFVSGGLKNVNVVGTSKIVVDESDVTYINGIRYKFGVPVSKSSVIESGFDNILGKNANNTTINIVDAGEDVTIPYGSTTFENVINAGQDKILPDIPDYGVSSLNSIVPITNYTGAYDQQTGTSSLPNVILQKVNPVIYFKNI
jgi:hypothetical protein